VAEKEALCLVLRYFHCSRDSHEDLLAVTGAWGQSDSLPAGYRRLEEAFKGATESLRVKLMGGQK
jgi:hypothetical protein